MQQGTLFALQFPKLNNNRTMKTYNNEEACAQAFAALGPCYHLWTPDCFEVIFTSEDDFKAGMTIIGICAKMVPDVRILTFEIMSNHIHMAVAGSESRIAVLFNLIKSFLIKWSRASGRSLKWKEFNASTRLVTTLEDIRNVIAYINRNGFVVTPSCTPFSFRWGANRFFYNPDARKAAALESGTLTLRERQRATRSRKADGVGGLLKFEGCALTLSFCDIDAGEKLFRSASHYFFKISRSVESSKSIASELSEKVFCTDDELFAAVSMTCHKKFGTGLPSRIPAEAKVDIAKMMHYEYNATRKQIARILKLSPALLETMFPQIE